MDTTEELTGLAKELKDGVGNLRKQQEQLAGAQQLVLNAVEKGFKLDKETQDNIDAAIAKANDQSQQINEVQQKIDDIKKSINEGTKNQPLLTVRGQIEKMLGNDTGKATLEKMQSRESRNMVLKDVIDSGSVSTGMKREPYIDSLVSLERPALTILSLLNTVPIQTDSVKYGKQNLRTNNAAIVPEGTTKPYSEYGWTNATALVELIAHLAKMSLQALWDAPRLAAEIESEMRFGLALKEEWEVLNGDGTSGHLSGILQNATPYAVPAGMNTSGVLTKLDMLRVAILQVHLANARADGMVLNPIDMAEIDLMRRDPDNGGGYLFSAPDENTGVTRLWRLPVVESASMDSNAFLVGAFKYAVNLYRRMGATVAISTENDDDFEKNLATMRCESRLAVAVRRPYAVVKGAFNAGS